MSVLSVDLTVRASVGGGPTKAEPVGNVRPEDAPSRAPGQQQRQDIHCGGPGVREGSSPACTDVQAARQVVTVLPDPAGAVVDDGLAVARGVAAAGQQVPDC
ncbi:hypothetical protein DIZ27_22810 [Streptomyces sp. NWU339]|nr:hypothetical protein DIZ27_22810 [Streptomyces sp. NWU339]